MIKLNRELCVLHRKTSSAQWLFPAVSAITSCSKAAYFPSRHIPQHKVLIHDGETNVQIGKDKINEFFWQLNKWNWQISKRFCNLERGWLVVLFYDVSTLFGSFNAELYFKHGPPHMAMQKLDDQHEHTFSNYVRIRDVVQKTGLRRWTIGKSGERGSGISVLPARHDDDDYGDDISNNSI